MNKKELVAALAAKSGMTKTDSKKAVESLIEVVTETLKAGEKIAITGFCTLSVSERAARTGINPRTKEVIQIPAKKVVKFTAGADLDEAII